MRNSHFSLETVVSKKVYNIYDVNAIGFTMSFVCGGGAVMQGTYFDLCMPSLVEEDIDVPSSCISHARSSAGLYSFFTRKNPLTIGGDRTVISGVL